MSNDVLPDPPRGGLQHGSMCVCICVHVCSCTLASDVSCYFCSTFLVLHTPITYTLDREFLLNLSIIRTPITYTLDREFLLSLSIICTPIMYTLDREFTQSVHHTYTYYIHIGQRVF